MFVNALPGLRCQALTCPRHNGGTEIEPPMDAYGISIRPRQWLQDAETIGVQFRSFQHALGWCSPFLLIATPQLGQRIKRKAAHPDP